MKRSKCEGIVIIHLRYLAASCVDKVQKNVQYIAIDCVQYHRLLFDFIEAQFGSEHCLKISASCTQNGAMCIDSGLTCDNFDVAEARLFP